MAEANSTQEERLVETYRAYEDLWNGDFTKMDVVSDSIAFYNPNLPDGELHGRDAFEAYLRELRSAFPDWHVTADELLAGDGIIMKEWTVRGTHEGEFRGVPGTGREIEFSGMATDIIEDSQVQETRLYHDPTDVADQLGLTER